MKLYSKGQLMLFCIASAGLVLLLALGFGVLGENSDDVPVIAEDITPIDTSKYYSDGSELVNASASSDEVIPVVSDAKYTEDERVNIHVYDSRNQAVVNITTEVIGYNLFFEPEPQEGSSGSGSIINKDGYVLTNYHVVKGAQRVYIGLADGTQVEGDVIGSDPENDMAVIKFDPDGRELVTIPLGTSADLRVGQKVLAIGNPFAFERTLTTGIVSGLGRPLKNNNGLIIQGMIQTDASINPGNSGGPLLDAKGNMVGINTMIYSPSGGSVGIGFAVPVDTARRVIPDLVEFGMVRRGWIDIVPIQLFPQLVRYARLPVAKGILVSRVLANGNADDLQGGSRNKAVRYGRTVIYLGGDIIVGIDDQPIEDLSDLYTALEDSKPGEVVEVSFYRDGQLRKTNITLSLRPEQFNWE